PVVQFTAPTKDRAQGKLVDIPSVKCLSVDQARAKVKNAGFSVSVASAQVASQCPAGTVDRTNPAGSTTKGGGVQLVVSKGPGAPAPPYVGGDGDNGNGGRGNRDMFPNGDTPDTGDGTDANDCPIPWVC